MIEYWQSYEIDGSDSSYNVVVAEREKCIELIDFYLRLKVVHHGKPVKIYLCTGKDKKILENLTFTHEHLDDLWDIIRHCNLQRMALEYTYVAPDSLYPEVKRELIDMLTHHAGVNHTFVNPTFSSLYCSTSYINIGFRVNTDRPVYDMACSENYYQIISKEAPMLMIDFDCMLNGPHELMFYGMHKIKDIFPEFEIDMHTSDELLSAYILHWDELIMEGIPVESTDYVQTLKRILSNPRINLHPDQYTIYLGRLPSGFESFDPLIFWTDETAAGTSVSNNLTPDDINYYKALQGIFGKRMFTVEEYIEKVQKAATAGIFSDPDFETFTSFDIEVEQEKGRMQRAVLKFVRRPGGQQPLLMVLVPYKLRERLEKWL